MMYRYYFTALWSLGATLLTFTLQANPAVQQLRHAQYLLEQLNEPYEHWCDVHRESLEIDFACEPHERRQQQLKDKLLEVTQEYRAMEARVAELEASAAEIEAQLADGATEDVPALNQHLADIQTERTALQADMATIAEAQNERVREVKRIDHEHLVPLVREMDRVFPLLNTVKATFQQQYDEALAAYLEGLDLLGPSQARLRENGRRQLSYIVDSKTLLQIEYSWPQRLIKLEGLFARTVQQARVAPRVAASSRPVRSVAPPRRSFGDLHFETFCQQSLQEVYSTRNPCGDGGIEVPAPAPLLSRPPLEAMARMSLTPVEAPRQDPSTTGGFPPDTLILTQDGQWRPIDMVRAQHILPSAGDEQHAMDHPVQVVQLFSHIKPRMVQLSFVDCHEQVTAAEDQRFLVHTGHGGQAQWVQAKDLQVGVAIASRSGEPRVIASLEVVPGSRVVWNMELEHIHTYFVGQELGLVVHNALLKAPMLVWKVGQAIGKVIGVAVKHRAAKEKPQRMPTEKSLPQVGALAIEVPEPAQLPTQVGVLYLEMFYGNVPGVHHTGLRVRDVASNTVRECHFGPQDTKSVNVGNYSYGAAYEPDQYKGGKFIKYVDCGFTTRSADDVVKDFIDWSGRHPVYVVGRVDCWQSVYAVLRSLGKKHYPPLSAAIVRRGTGSTHLLGCTKCEKDRIPGVAKPPQNQPEAA
ncbi:MAG: polymorphic toxin-type HINT domain-containing protein [Zetaproteobacteria bacterium]|nr:polymorphic toxin-type HINT domain-containing protein [Zetaproteobacteria bacterium]